MNEGDEELTIVLLAVLHHEERSSIANLAPQPAALQGSESTSTERGDYSVRPTDPVARRLNIIQSGHPSIFMLSTGVC
jgi:hypothetical protein